MGSEGRPKPGADPGATAAELELEASSCRSFRPEWRVWTHARSDLFERRRFLMEQWAEFLANGDRDR